MGKLLMIFFAIAFGIWIGGYLALRASENIQAYKRPGGMAAVNFEFSDIAADTQPIWIPLTFVEGELRAASGTLPPPKPMKLEIWKR